MKTSVLAIASAINIQHLGVCALCMQISFLLMITSWAIFVWIIFYSLYFGIVFSLLPISLTIVWIGHILSRARKNAIAISRMQYQEKSINLLKRREAIRAFGQGIVSAAAVSVAFPLTARAQTSQNTNDKHQSSKGILDSLRNPNLESVLDEHGSVIMTSCSSQCKFDYECSNGCICWPELGRCVKLGGKEAPTGS